MIWIPLPLQNVGRGCLGRKLAIADSHSPAMGDNQVSQMKWGIGMCALTQRSCETNP
mgnify:CR=1 FL=1